MWVTGCRLNAGVVEISNNIETGGHRCLGTNADGDQQHAIDDLSHDCPRSCFPPIPLRKWGGISSNLGCPGGTHMGKQGRSLSNTSSTRRFQMVVSRLA